MILPDFWVPQSSLPPPYLLLIFTFIHIVALAFVLYFWLLTKSHGENMIRYLYGNQYKHIFFKNLLRGIRLLYLSLVLFIVNNIFSHLSAYFYPEKKSYLFIGFNSVGYFIGTILFFSGFIYLFIYFFKSTFSLSRSMQSKYAAISIGVLFLLFAIITFFEYSESLQEYLNLLAFSVFSYLFVVNFLIFYGLQNNQYKDTIMIIRYFTALMVQFVFHIYVFVILSFLPNESMQPTEFPTRTPLVEFYIFVTDLWTVITAALVYLWVVLPQNYMAIFKLKDQEIFIASKEQIDLFNRKIVYDWREENVESSEIPKSQISDYLILCYSGEEAENMHLLRAFKEYFQVNDVFGLGSYYEEYFNMVAKKKYNLVFISDDSHETIDEILQIIEKDYDWKISFKDGIISYDGFEYKSDDTEFALVLIIPSFWNYQNKLWLILHPPEIEMNVNQFFSDYLAYFDRKSDEDIIFMILKFTCAEDGEFENIPFNHDEPEAPDWSYIAYF